MKSLVRSPATLRLRKKALVTVSDFSPDDLAIVQKRQDWRLRVAHICIDNFEASDLSRLAGGRRSLSDVEGLADRFAKISDYVKRALPSLLETGVTVNELEAVRYQVNYFLEEAVRNLRERIQQRLETESPLESSSQEEVESGVSEALEGRSDALCVFIDDLVKLAHFELEVGSQRERIRLLLGGDRRLSGLGNNEAIMTAPPYQLRTAVDDFMTVSSYLREHLPPALGKASPYPALEEELRQADAQFALLVRERIVPFEESLESVSTQASESQTRQLRESFCAVVGELRTFLQTSFAHIASKDPRSTESSYHFFLREFSNEAQKAMLLLSEIRALENLVTELQQVDIAGLRLTPDNLARILRVLFIKKDEEKKRIPSGEGWKVMSAFLEKLRDELVPRLQKVCALDGIRYEDKSFLSEWAMDLARNCTLCLTQHDIGYGFLKEMGRLREDPDSLAARQAHTHIVTARTCKSMQESLTEICMTLTASIPYVGIMRGGIERRASVFFHRQQKILESGPGAGAGVPAGREHALAAPPDPVGV